MQRIVRLLALASAFLAFLASPAAAQYEAVQARLDLISERVKAKAMTGRTSEADLAEELNDLSDLQNEYRTQKTIAAELLYARAEIYEKVIKDRHMALILYEQAATDYPGTVAGVRAAMTVEAARATADDAPPPRARRSSGRPERSRRPLTRSATDNTRRVGTPQVGAMFPDFTVQDLDELPLSTEQFRGQYLLVDFWSTSCDDCMRDMDRKMLVYRKYHDKGFEIIGINRDRDRAPMINYINQHMITWPQHFDRDGQLSRRYNVTSLPASFLLDREGRVIAINVNSVELDRTLERHFAYGF